MDKSKLEYYKELRKKISLKEVSFGSVSVILFLPEEIEESQLGYSVDENGKELKVGDNNWLVIGMEDSFGDPIFVDFGEEGLPVYTAMHGEGRWEPIQIALSLDNFVKALNLVSKLSEGRSNPVELENNPLPEEEYKHLINEIAKLNIGGEIYFWEIWLGKSEYWDWL